jgi:hypothetical protein
MSKSGAGFNWNSDWEDRYRALSYEHVVASTESLTRRDPATSPAVLKIGHGYALFHGRDSAMTAASAIGTGDGDFEQQIAVVEDFFLSRGCNPRLWTNSTTTPEFLRLLEGRGYRSVTTVQTWIRPATTVPGIPLAPAITVRVVDEPEAQLWIDTVATGFLENREAVHTPVPKSMADAFFSFAFAAGFTAVLGFRHGQPAGGGVLAQGHQLAILRTASTRLHHRGNGVQRALIAARLQLAMQSGCQLCLATTAIDDTDHSARNMALFGFQKLRLSSLMEKQGDH